MTPVKLKARGPNLAHRIIYSGPHVYGSGLKVCPVICNVCNKCIVGNCPVLIKCTVMLWLIVFC